MLARGSLGNPWLFEQVLGTRADEPTRDEVLDELDWLIDRAVEHMGSERGGRWLRKAYPWYLDRLNAPKSLQAALQQAGSLAEVRTLLSGLREGALAA
jgi:tRNA-dihydrouridine synthase